jgi:hypothetical protein
MELFAGVDIMMFDYSVRVNLVCCESVLLLRSVTGNMPNIYAWEICRRACYVLFLQWEC